MLGNEYNTTSTAPLIPGPEPPAFVFEDGENDQSTMAQLSMLRRSGQFCDVDLQVGGYSIKAHRAILACASPYLFELFVANEAKTDASSSAVGPYQYYHLPSFDYESFNMLVGYAYSSR